MCGHIIDEYIEDKEWIVFYDMRLYYLEVVDMFFEMYDELEWYLAQHIPLNQREQEMWYISRILKDHLTY
jgi:hypothetical protein